MDRRPRMCGSATCALVVKYIQSRFIFWLLLITEHRFSLKNEKS
jgi:hypothetical protein